MPLQDARPRPTPSAPGLSHRDHHETTFIGVCLLNDTNEVIAANDEAVRLLSYPDLATEELDPRWTQEIRMLVTSGSFSRDGTWRGELRSGRRRYVCRVMPLCVPRTGPLATHLAILIERPRTNRSAVSSLSRNSHLTKREAEVVDLLIAGLTNKEIACWLSLSANTVKTILHTIMIKLEVTTRAGIVGALVPRTE